VSEVYERLKNLEQEYDVLEKEKQLYYGESTKLLKDNEILAE
jgi:hypothetical protein